MITGVTSAMRIAQEETFGPVAPIMVFDTLDEALEIANETEFGLTAAVFTRSLHDAWRAAEELRHGTVHINETTNYWDQMAPFGGAKKSGAGRELAGWIFDAVTETKQITFDLELSVAPNERGAGAWDGSGAGVPRAGGQAQAGGLFSSRTGCSCDAPGLCLCSRERAPESAGNSGRVGAEPTTARGPITHAPTSESVG